MYHLRHGANVPAIYFVSLENPIIPARSRRQAMDWSLVLISQGIEAAIEHDAAAGWFLVLSPEDFGRASAAIQQYQAENRRWPWRRRIHSAMWFDWASAGWVFLIVLFFSLEQTRPGMREAGVMDGAAVSHGQWWRLLTAIFLHADLAHLLSNAGLGFVLLGLTMAFYGTGAGLLAAYFAGLGGNLGAWLLFPDHRSLGASGMVMGCLGLLAAQATPLWHRAPNIPKYFLTSILAGVMLFALLGLSPGTDVAAHLAGFISGILLGSLASLTPALPRNTGANIAAGGLFALLTILPWWLAWTAAQ